MKRVSIIGTVGVPANYGGFESMVENLIDIKSSEELEYTIYCSSKNYPDKLDTYKNAKLKYIPLNANGSQSIIYDIISLIKATKDSDVILILGVSGCCFLPIYRIFSNKKLVINIDGLEHRRDKWGKWTRKFLKFSEKMAVKYGDIIISDNKGIQDYVSEEYGKESVLIAYGGDHVLSERADDELAVLEKYGLTDKSYSFSVCRIEPENNVHVVLEAFKQSGDNLVFVGNWDRSDYGLNLKNTYSKCSNIKILPAIYDLKILNALRSNCSRYIHGHSAGGTNPSLVEAMFFGKPIIAFDVVYNRESTEGKAVYFSSVDSLVDVLEKPIEEYSMIGNSMRDIAERRYRWETIVKQYEDLF